MTSADRKYLWFTVTAFAVLGLVGAGTVLYRPLLVSLALHQVRGTDYRNSSLDPSKDRWLRILADAARGGNRPAAEAAATAWLDLAEKAPRNGYNPQLKWPMGLPEWGAAVLVREADLGPSVRRRCAASILSRHPRPKELHEFWRRQLGSRDAQMRDWAVLLLADIADPGDLEPVLAQAVECTFLLLHHALAARLRDWKDRRVVPCLVEFLDSPEWVVRANAALSLGILPFGPQIKDDEPALRRWWQEKGAADFGDEVKWWQAFKKRLRPVPDLEPPW